MVRDTASVTSQGFLAAPPASARFLTFTVVDGVEARALADALGRLAEAHDPSMVVGVGPAVAARLGRAIDGLRPFPADLPLFPSTQARGALFVALLHADRGAQLDAALSVARAVAGAFVVDDEVDAFVYRGGRDLSGFEDGTENPKAEKAVAASVITGRGPGLDGGSFVATQKWIHDLDAMKRMSPEARDHAGGQRLEDNDEIDDAPPSAHVKRTAQESFEPEAFMLRRSMPFGGIREHGLFFVAYVENLDRFERPLLRMSGREDGVVDGLFGFSRPLTGAYFFVPPILDGRLDLRALGL
jgi:putative iron-dependent peroxidase